MPEYYLYLARTTWPDLLVLFFVLFIIMLKAVEISLKAWRSGRGWRTLLPWLIKLLGWSGILGIYLLMFLPDNPDWLARPALSSGTIVEIRALEQGKVMIQMAQEKKVSGEASEYLVLYAESQFGSKVRVGDKVEFIYLPHKKEIVKCLCL